MKRYPDLCTESVQFLKVVFSLLGALTTFTENAQYASYTELR